MIVATPDGKFFSEVWPENEKYLRRMKRISAEQARHLCRKSEDYVVYRRLTLREKIISLLW